MFSYKSSIFLLIIEVASLEVGTKDLYVESKIYISHKWRTSQLVHCYNQMGKMTEYGIINMFWHQQQKLAAAILLLKFNEY